MGGVACRHISITPPPGCYSPCPPTQHLHSPWTTPLPPPPTADDVHAASHDGASLPQSSKKRRKAEAPEKLGKAPKARRGGAKDEEFGVTRGIDFKGVRTIINFDLPSSVQGYVHRVGRTGKGGGGGSVHDYLNRVRMAQGGGAGLMCLCVFVRGGACTI